MTTTEASGFAFDAAKSAASTTGAAEWTTACSISCAEGEFTNVRMLASSLAKKFFILTLLSVHLELYPGRPGLCDCRLRTAEEIVYYKRRALDGEVLILGLKSPLL